MSKESIETIKATIVHVDSPMGRRPLLAPMGSVFDKTSEHLWSRLLFVAGESLKPQKRVRDKAVLDGQVEVLAIVIANANGMSAFFWSQEAKRLTVIDERKYL